MSTKFDIEWTETTNTSGRKLKDIESNTLVQDLNYADGGKYGYWDGVGVLWFYKDGPSYVTEDGTTRNCIAVHGTIKIKIEVEK